MGNLGEIFVSFQISARSRWDVGNIAEISLRFRMTQTTNITPRSRQSRRDLTILGEISYILPRSRQDSERQKHDGKISAKSWQSRRDLTNLSKNFAWETAWNLVFMIRFICPGGWPEHYAMQGRHEGTREVKGRKAWDKGIHLRVSNIRITIITWIPYTLWTG